MRTRCASKFKILLFLLIACIGLLNNFSFSRAASGGNIGNITVDINYTGGTTQQVVVDATALVTGYGITSWELYYGDGTPVSATGSTGTLTENPNYHYKATIDLKLFNESTYFVHVIIDNGGGFSGWDNSSLFQLKHVYYFAGIPSIIYTTDTDTLVILSVPFYTSQDLDGDTFNNDDLVPQAKIFSTATDRQWVMYDAGGNAIAQGDLSFSGGNWISNDVNVKWKNGNFTIGARFKLTNGTTLETPAANRAPFTRNNATEWYIILVSILAGAAAAIFISIAIYNKRHASRDLQKKDKKKDKKEIKVLEISKEEIKKAKAGKAPPPKEEVKEETKGVTKKSGDLIFEVPKWEEGDADK